MPPRESSALNIDRLSYIKKFGYIDSKLSPGDTELAHYYNAYQVELTDSAVAATTFPTAEQSEQFNKRFKHYKFILVGGGGYGALNAGGGGAAAQGGGAGRSDDIDKLYKLSSGLVFALTVGRGGTSENIEGGQSLFAYGDGGNSDRILIANGGKGAKNNDVGVGGEIGAALSFASGGIAWNGYDGTTTGGGGIGNPVYVRNPPYIDSYCKKLGDAGKGGDPNKDGSSGFVGVYLFRLAD